MAPAASRVHPRSAAMPRSKWLLIAAGASAGADMALGDKVFAKVPYVADGVVSEGYVTYDSHLCTAASKCPGVMIVPDWNGMNDYEKERACMLADLGYVAFAADIYGVDTPQETMADWVAASGAHRNNATLFMAKIHGGLSRMMEMDVVDTSKMAALGYCFGGTGLVNVAMAGHTGFEDMDFPTGLMGVVSFHGGLGNGYYPPQNGTTRPKLLLHSGAKDDANEHISQLTDDLENVSAIYEISRYGSGVYHSFTEWDANTPMQSMYDEVADQRSWSATTHFLEELFVPDAPAPSSKPDMANVPGDFTMLDVEYMADGVESLGHAVYNSTKCTAASKCPGVMIVPDWNGMNDYEKERAYMLAEHGYVAFAADIYGVDTPQETMEDWVAASGAHRNNATLFMAKIHGGLSRMMEMDVVDTSKMAGIGYCFGGTGLVNVAMAGHTGFEDMDFPTGLMGVVSFHGGLGNGYYPPQSGTTRPKLLLHSGAKDDANEHISQLTDDLENVSAAYEISRYGSGVYHSFTEWDANTPMQSMYDARADARSWQDTLDFFMELFGTSTPSAKSGQCELMPLELGADDDTTTVAANDSDSATTTVAPSEVSADSASGLRPFGLAAAFVALALVGSS